MWIISIYHIYNFTTFARKYTFINNLHLVSENTELKYGIFPFYFTGESKTVILCLFTAIKIKKNEINVHANGDRAHAQPSLCEAFDRTL